MADFLKKYRLRLVRREAIDDIAMMNYKGVLEVYQGSTDSFDAMSLTVLEYKSLVKGVA